MANTKLKWWVVGSLAVVGGVGLMTRVHAGPWHHRAESAAELSGLMERRMDHLLDVVDADDAQREKVDAIVAANAPQMFALIQEGRAVRKELKTALLAEHVDRAQLAAGKQKLDLLAQRMADLGIDGLASVAEVLNPAQRKQIADKLANHMHE